MQHREVCTNLFPSRKSNSIAPRNTFPACQCRTSGKFGRMSRGQSSKRLGISTSFGAAAAFLFADLESDQAPSLRPCGSRAPGPGPPGRAAVRWSGPPAGTTAFPSQQVSSFRRRRRGAHTAPGSGRPTRVRDCRPRISWQSAAV